MKNGIPWVKGWVKVRSEALNFLGLKDGVTWVKGRVWAKFQGLNRMVV